MELKHISAVKDWARTALKEAPPTSTNARRVMMIIVRGSFIAWHLCLVRYYIYKLST